MDFDALLWLSFGGPEGPDDVMPFLENVTRGRGVPRERLLEVAEHYHHFGGVSPINELNRAAIANVEAELAKQGIDLPVYFGNRNWTPYAEEAVAAMHCDGVRRALVFATSAYGGYSSCRQYDEDIVRARASVGEDAPELVKLRQFYDHPLFVELFAEATRSALATVPDGARLVFTAHSVPIAADRAAGPPELGGELYSRQISEAAARVAEAVGVSEYDVVWQSRSGPPSVPWLEPDIVDHIDALHAAGVRAVVVCPVGFMSDHLEVIWDLDNEAADRAKELGMGFARAATPGQHPRFAELVVDLIREHLEGRDTARGLGCTVNGEPCAVGCCAPARPKAHA